MTRLRPILAFAARVVIIALAVISIPWRAGAALVASGDAPIVSPPTADALMGYVQTYGWIVGSLTVAYLAAKWLLKKNESAHWIAKGRALAVVTTIVGVAGAALQAYTSGTSWSGVLATAVLGLLHLADAQVTPRPVKAQAQALSVMAVLAAAGVAVVAAIPLLPAVIVAPSSGCSNPKVAALEHALWDCTAPGRADAVSAVTPAVVSVIKAAGSADGKAIDLSTVKSAITKANVMSEAGVLLSCAMASAIAILTAPAPAGAPGAPAAAPFELDPVAVRAVWDVVKRDQFGGADFKVSGGAVL